MSALARGVPLRPLSASPSRGLVPRISRSLVALLNYVMQRRSFRTLPTDNAPASWLSSVHIRHAVMLILVLGPAAISLSALIEPESPDEQPFIIAHRPANRRIFLPPVGYPYFSLSAFHIRTRRSSMARDHLL